MTLSVEEGTYIWNKSQLVCPTWFLYWLFKSSNRVTGSTYTATILMARVLGFRLRIEQGNKLPFDNINPEDK